MLKLIIDQDFDHDIVRGLAQRIPNLDAVTALEVGLSTASDAELLAWADQAERIIVTHDRKTMPSHAGRRMTEGKRVFGVFVVSRRLQIVDVINDLEIMVMCMTNASGKISFAIFRCSRKPPHREHHQQQRRLGIWRNWPENRRRIGHGFNGFNGLKSADSVQSVAHSSCLRAAHPFNSGLVQANAGIHFAACGFQL